MIHFEVRLPGDGCFQYFTEPIRQDEYGEENYDPTSLESARQHADRVGGWVTKITEELVHGRPH